MSSCHVTCRPRRRAVNELHPTHCRRIAQNNFSHGREHKGIACWCSQPDCRRSADRLPFFVLRLWRALRVFGRVVPELNLAANWLRFPRTSPAPRMVAARRGHVFVLEQHLGGDIWMAFDANSGGHVMRMHPRSLRGYTVVNPDAAG